MLWFSLGFYGLFAVIICAITSAKGTLHSFRKSFKINAVISLLYCWAIFSLAHILSMFALLIGGEWLFRKQHSPRWIWIVALIAVIFGHSVVGLISGFLYVREMNQIEKSLPSISPDEIPLVRKSFPSNPVVVKDERVSGHFLWYRNLRDLETIHQSTIQRFINAPGFGRGRMRTPSLTNYQWNKAEEPEMLPDSTVIVERIEDWMPLSPGETERIDVFHSDLSYRFAKPDSLGLELSPKKVVGFLPHGLEKDTLTTVRFPSQTDATLLSVELVGLLMASEPRVYQSKNFPSMTEAKNSPTRPLDSFESWGLAEITKGQSTVAMKQRNGNLVRMVGAIRADQNCAKCHEVKNGELLGLFSYTLRAKK